MNTIADLPAAVLSTPGVSPGEHILQVQNLRKSFDLSPPWLSRVLTGAGHKVLKAVDDISFSIKAGQTLSLVGESGCGKSTVARCIAGLQPLSGGSVRFKGVGIGEIARGRHPLRREAQMIFQDPYGSLNPRSTVGRTVAEPIVALGLADSKVDLKDTVGQLLTSVGLAAADATKYPHEFSGGQRQRIAIARALASKPSFIVCDEPTSALDVSVQAQILNLMRDLQDSHGLTYLLISHNLAVVDHMSDVVGVMYLGRLVELALKEDLFTRPRHPYTRLLIGAMPGLREIGVRKEPMQGEVPSPLNPPSGCAFNPRCPFAVDRCRSERPAMRLVDGQQVACHRAEELA